MRIALDSRINITFSAFSRRFALIDPYLYSPSANPLNKTVEFTSPGEGFTVAPTIKIDDGRVLLHVQFCVAKCTIRIGNVTVAPDVVLTVESETCRTVFDKAIPSPVSFADIPPLLCHRLRHQAFAHHGDMVPALFIVTVQTITGCTVRNPYV